MKERDLPRASDLLQQIAACDQRLEYLDAVRFDLTVPNAIAPQDDQSTPMNATLSSCLGMDETVVFGEARRAIRERILSDKATLRGELERIGVELEAKAA